MLKCRDESEFLPSLNMTQCNNLEFQIINSKEPKLLTCK